MKRFFSFLLIVLTSTFIFAQEYQIVDVDYDIEGCRGISFGKTNKVSLEIKCPVDTETVFESKEKFEAYLTEYKQQLNNLRAFATIDLNYTESLNETTQINQVTLNINLIDSNHLLALPYPKYDSNSGMTLKIKAKDSNFLGTLNPLSTDLYVNYKDLTNEWKFGLNFAYNYPFKAGIFNASWNNSLGIDYTIGADKPESYTDIGVSFALPKDKYSINFGFNQSIDFENIFKFDETLSLSTPVYLYKAPNFSTVTYTPSFSFKFDYNVNTTQLTPNNFEISFGHSISNSKVDWIERFRKGYSVSLSNSYSFEFENNFVVPNVSLEGALFSNFKLLDKPYFDRCGIYSRLYVFTLIDVPGIGTKGRTNVGSRLRGILNDNMVESPYGVVLNLDFPINIITTNFKHTFFNFTMQFSPFIDMALVNEPNNNFNISNKNLCAGMEVLVFPHRFSSYTIRGSIGFDVKKVLKSPNKIKGLWNNKEIYIGLELHY